MEKLSNNAREDNNIWLKIIIKKEMNIEIHDFRKKQNMNCYF